MKLAEALQERADLNKKIERLKERLLNNALVQEGEKPVEQPAELKKEFDFCIERLEALMANINLTNCKTFVDGVTLTEMIAKKDSLLLKATVLGRLVDTASSGTERARHTEIKILPTVSVAELQKEAERLAKEIRLLDNKLQETNWTTELME